MQKVLWGIAIFWLSGATVWGQALSKAEACRLCLAQNLELRTQQAEVEVAHQAVSGAGAWPSASLVISDQMSGLAQNFFPWGSLSSQVAAAESQWRSQQAAWEASRLQVLQRCQDAFAELQAAQSKEQVAQKNLHLGEEILRLAELRFGAGSAPQIEVLNATTERNRARQELQLAILSRRQAQLKLLPLLGLNPDRQVSAEGDLLAESTLPAPELLREQARQHPRLQAQTLQVARAEHLLKLAEAQYNPCLSLMGGYDRAIWGPSLQVQLSIPLDWGQLNSQCRQREAALQQARRQMDALILEQETQIQLAYDTYRAALQLATEYPTQVLEPAEKSLQVSSYGYQRGATSYLQLLTFQQRLVGLRRESVDLSLQATKSLHALQAASNWSPGR